MIKIISIFTVLIMFFPIGGKSETQKHYDINGRLMGESRTLGNRTRHYGAFTLGGIPVSTQTRATSTEIRQGKLVSSYDRSGRISGKSNSSIKGRSQYYDGSGRYQGYSISEGLTDYHYNVFGYYMGKTVTIKKNVQKPKDNRLSSMTEWRAGNASSIKKQTIARPVTIQLKKPRNSTLSYGNRPNLLKYQPKQTLKYDKNN